MFSIAILRIPSAAFKRSRPRGSAIFFTAISAKLGSRARSPPAKPPERARQRDTQLNAILKGYWDHVRAEWNLARTSKGAKDAKKTDEVVHVIAGDFNIFPGIVDADAEGTEIERFHLTKNDFVCTIPETAATSSGGKSYDNMLVDTTTYKRYLPHGAVLKLVKQQNSAQSKIGLSDHNPVTLTLEFFEEVR